MGITAWPGRLRSVYIHLGVSRWDPPSQARTLWQMTTTATQVMPPSGWPTGRHYHVEILLRFARATEVITAEHHPDDRGGMPYVLHIVGGKHTGMQIHCATEQSVTRLFNEVVAARKSDTEHPFLAQV